MHPALHLVEVVSAIVGHLRPAPWQDSHTLAALARSCRVLSDPALDALWAEPPIWHLARQMSNDVWVIVRTSEPPDLCYTLVRVSILIGQVHFSYL
jgi:hypothetical protein